MPTQIKIKKEIIVFIVFGIVIAAFYGNTLKNGFVHDDIGQVVQNEYVHSLQYLPKTVTGCTWEYVFGGCKDSNYYRPFHSLSYLLTYQISPDPWIFHLVNLLYFLTAAFLAYILINKLTKSFILSFLTGLFFIIHPINNEVVNWIASVPELLFAVFALLSTIFFIKYRESSSKKNLIFCCLFYFFSMLSKEPAVLLPVIFFFVDVVILKVKFFSYSFKQQQNQPVGQPALAPLESELSGEPAPQTEKTGSDTIVSESVPDVIPGDDFDIGIKVHLREALQYFIFLLVAAGYFLIRIAVLGSIFGSTQLYYGTFTVPERIYAFFSLLGQYLIKFVYPYPLLFFYYFEKKADFLKPEFLIPASAVLVFVVAFALFLKKKMFHHALFLIWIFVFIFPVTFFVYSAGENIFAERYDFVPSIGFSFLLAYLFYYFWKTKKTARVYLLPIIILITAGAWFIVYPRNKIFFNDFTLYEATIKLNPKAYSIRRNLAVELMDIGQYERGKAELDKIIQLDPNWWDINKVYNQLGNYYRIIGDYDAAIDYYRKTIEVSGEWNHAPYNNLGALYLEKGEYMKSLLYLCRAMQLGPNAKETQNNFNRIVSLFGSVSSQEGLKKLYSDVTQGIFQESVEQRIKYAKTTCQDKDCDIMFRSDVAENEIVLPFLILASTGQGEMVQIKNRAFDPQTRIISLKIDSKYKSESLNVIFTTCGGIYYKVQVPPSQ